MTGRSRAGFDTSATEITIQKPAPELDILLAEIARRHPAFSCRDNLSREALYENRPQMPFVDTNILLYAISTQPEEADKTSKPKPF